MIGISTAPNERQDLEKLVAKSYDRDPLQDFSQGSNEACLNFFRSIETADPIRNA